MKGFIKRNIARMLCLTTCVSAIAVPLTACGNTEIKPLILATDVLDTVFNPFFYTSGSDGEIVSQTQIGMLSSDEKGQPAASWTEPSVALDYSIVKHGSKSDMKNENDYSLYYTDYYFAIKDNIKFSDGVLLTKDDVLFNLYMYLDPAYTGSNTMYSVKIDGLTEYRTQTSDLDEAAGADAYFQQDATNRLNSILAWAEEDDTTWADLSDYEFYENDKTIEDDINKIQEYYKDSLLDTWTTCLATDIQEEYKKYVDVNGNMIFTEPWELFLYYYDTITLEPHIDSESKKIDYYKATNNLPNTINIPGTADGRAGSAFRDVLVNYQYNAMFLEQKDATKSYKTNLISVMRSYPVNVNINEYLLSDVMHRRFQDNMSVKSVRGITIENMNAIPYLDEDGNEQSRSLKDQDGNVKYYDVLHIKVNGVDPKAIQNFSFTVAPGHYYSDSETWQKALDDTDDVEYFGVKFSDPDFMDSIRVNQLPLGAGPYAAAKSKGGKAKTKSDFCGSDSIVNFESNKYFLLGEPKIKYLRYKVISSTQLYQAVKTGEVHYASPSMKRDDISAINGSDSSVLNYAQAENLGYGYIGISAAYIPNLYIRKAIMTTFNANSCIESYYGSAASVIYRPMSKTLVDYYDTTWESYYQFDSTGAAARDYLELGGCTYRDGVWYDDKGKKLKYTFTIAGDSDDHPAQQLLLQSKQILEELGLEITVSHDSTALSKLSSGLLTVWAAAWSSSSDPDMYQVYHKDSQATSTTAWGYKYIFSTAWPTGGKGGYDEQKEIINTMSDLIDDGRETDVTDERKEIYDDALNCLMDLAVEFPTYQRKVYYVWKKGVLKENTMITGNNVTTYQSPLSRIWEVELA